MRTNSGGTRWRRTKILTIGKMGEKRSRGFVFPRPAEWPQAGAENPPASCLLPPRVVDLRTRWVTPAASCLLVCLICVCIYTSVVTGWGLHHILDSKGQHARHGSGRMLCYGRIAVPVVTACYPQHRCRCRVGAACHSCNTPLGM